MLLYRQQANAGDAIERQIDRVLAAGETPFQSYRFLHSPVHGVCVELDGDIQSCAADEAIYHEALVHPAMLLHPEPRRVLIMGGGEGATAREVLRHPSVERVVMVDIDETFCRLCREHLDWDAGAYDDPRLEVRHEDINAFLESSTETFDVVIGDLVDVADWDSPAAALYGDTLYGRLSRRMGTDATVATQAGALSAPVLDGHRRIRRTLAGRFPAVASYATVVPSFYHAWSFVVAAAGTLPRGAGAWRERLLAGAAKRGLELPGLGVEGLAAAYALPAVLGRELDAEG